MQRIPPYLKPILKSNNTFKLLTANVRTSRTNGKTTTVAVSNEIQNHNEISVEQALSIVSEDVIEKFNIRKKNYNLKEDKQVPPELRHYLPVYQLDITDNTYAELRDKFAQFEKPRFELLKRHTYVHYPFQKKDSLDKPVELKEVKETPIIEEKLQRYEEINQNLIKYLDSVIDPNDKYLMKFIDDFKAHDWRTSYCDPNKLIPMSSIPCGGCGALLHCQDTSLPGYVPSEKFKMLTENQLRKERCQRCLYLDTMGIYIKSNVDPKEYPKLISEIKDKKALVILMIDLTDFPNSIWPGIIDLIGPTRPIYVVANKVDIIPNDNYLLHTPYLERVEAAVRKSLLDTGVDRGRNIKHVSLISAKTGFGVEELISHLQQYWAKKGHVYIVGSANVGKSSLFNAFLQSDYCLTEASDLIDRATTSPWPGTTLNLLKFPILHPNEWQLHLRTKRLNHQYRQQYLEYVLRKQKYRDTQNTKYATLMGRIGMTFKKFNNYNSNETYLLEPVERNEVTVKRQNLDFAKGFLSKAFYCYDTPGVVHDSQFIDLLTAQEIQKTLPREMIVTQTFTMYPGQTLLIGGVARLDLLSHRNYTGIEKVKRFKGYKKTFRPLQGPKKIFVSIFCSKHLPINIMETSLADKFYNMFLEEGLLVVPEGNPERLKDFPPLEGKEFEVKGVNGLQCASDIILSSAGWVSVTSYANYKCVMKAYTPLGKGLEQRSPPLLDFAVNLQRTGVRIEIPRKNAYSSVMGVVHPM